MFQITESKQISKIKLFFDTNFVEAFLNPELIVIVSDDDF